MYVSFFLIAGFDGCSATHSPGSDVIGEELTNFQDIFDKVIEPKCLSCHSGSSPSAGIDLSSYELILSSETVVPGNSSASSFYTEVYSASMPVGGSLTASEIEAIGDWIDDGAKDSSGNEANVVPVVDAGEDQSITLPQSSATLTGTASDEDGTIASIQWSQLSGPDTATLSGEATLSLAVSNLSEGTYTFKLTVIDDQGAEASDSVSVVVASEPNELPVVSAGSDVTITLPQTSTSLSGSASDSDGSIASITWSQISGSVTATIDSANSLSTGIQNLSQAGTYEFKLEVTDDDGASASDTVKVTVNPAGNLLPVANAGSDQSIQLPTDAITLSGSGTDSDGSVVSYLWTQTSGPSTATLSNETTTTLTASDLVEGSYTFKLSVTDDKGDSGTDTVVVTVLSAPKFSEIYNTIIAPKCLSCHSGSQPKGSYGMDNYQLVITRVVAGDSSSSTFYMRVIDNTMPKGSGTLSDSEKSSIRDWIDAGAANN